MKKKKNKSFLESHVVGDFRRSPFSLLSLSVALHANSLITHLSHVRQMNNDLRARERNETNNKNTFASKQKRKKVVLQRTECEKSQPHAFFLYNK